ncbi:MAG: hypothetical protein AAF845_07760 [Bacteroidota bacterium]
MRRCLFLLSLTLLVACADADAPEAEAPSEVLTSAEAVADAMQERFEANTLAVDGFTVTAAGAEMRYRRVEDDTTSLDPLRIEGGRAGDDPLGPGYELLGEHVPNVARLARGLRRATLVGRVNRDGRDAYLFSTNDPSVLLGEDAYVAAGDSTQTRVYVDVGTFDVLEIYRTLSDSTLAEPITDRLIYSDFRDVDGLTLPFQIRHVLTGITQTLDSNQRMMRGGQLGLAKQQLEGQPPSPERDAQLAEIESELRAITDGIAERTLDIEAVRVGLPEAE